MLRLVEILLVKVLRGKQVLLILDDTVLPRWGPKSKGPMGIGANRFGRRRGRFGRADVG
ncbi:MAG: transposase [Thermoguttaceae bacterium]|nr:transposase [Thermoguttaceae bacterium]MDW8036539.1 hypothetical protein [Thermoguttaceae bacterium]